jgi:hypothetical protein
MSALKGLIWPVIGLLVWVPHSLGADSMAEWIKSFNKSYPSETAKIKQMVHQGIEPKESDFSKEYKELLYNLYQGYATKITHSKTLDSGVSRITPQFEFFKKALGKLEYREDEVDTTSDRVRAHLIYLEEKKYKFKFRAFIHYMSWQSQASLVGPFETTSLLTTNLGFCPGLGMSFENRYWALSLDLSGLYGSGGVSAVQGLVEYQQSQVPAIGGRLALGGGRIVSASGSEVGLRGSLMFVRQSLTRPTDTQYSVNQDKTLSYTVSLFSRWRLGKVYLETDFGRTIARPSTLWSIGVGAVF